MKTRPRTLSDFRAIGKRKLAPRTAEEAKELHDQRQRNRLPMEPKPGKYAELAARNRQRRATPVCVPLGNTVARRYLAQAKRANPRLREWSLGAEATADRSCSPYREATKGSNSDWHKRSTFQRGIRVYSVATCTASRVAVLALGADVHSVPAPRGYRWDIDTNGLYLRGRAGSYHPTASELLTGGKSIVASLKDAANARRLTRQKGKQQQRAILKAEREGATVCLADSLRAGNCRAGTETWASRHGLDSRKHYTPSEVLSLANGDLSRVALVVTVALRRHRVEMERGYAELAEHRA